MEAVLVYLDQNHASRVAKYLMGQPSHEGFGDLYRALRERRPLVPPSPFHVLETRGGYLLPVLQGLFAEFSPNAWVRPWQQVVARQAAPRAPRPASTPVSRPASRPAPAHPGPPRSELLATGGDWTRAARLEPLADALELPLTGDFTTRARTARTLLAERLTPMLAPQSRGRQPARVAQLPFVELLARLLAFRSLDRERLPQPSDLLDLIMAATVAPYVDALATDRYLREALARVGFRGRVFSGRRPEVAAFARFLREAPVAVGYPGAWTGR